jgi:hypothetical protein
MTKEEFCALPAAARFDALFEALRDRLATMPAPKVGAPTTAQPTVQWEPVRSPKYDAKLARRGGFVFMSEMLLHDLEWWLAKKREGAASGSQYAGKDAKAAAELERWVAWRTQCPAEAWNGIRGEARVTAAAPSRDAELHPWDEDARPPAPVASRGAFSDEDYGGATDEEIPF